MKTPARHYRPNFNQYLAGRRLAARRDFWHFEALILGAFSAAYVILGLLPEIEIGDGKSLREAVLVTGMAALGYLFWDWIRFKRRISEEYEAFIEEPPHLYSIRDEGIEISGSNTYGIESWDYIDHWSETHNSIFLFGKERLTGVYLSRIVSKNQLSVRDLEFLTRTLAERGIRKK